MALELIVKGYGFFSNLGCFDVVMLAKDNTKACQNCINLPAKYNVDKQ